MSELFSLAGHAGHRGAELPLGPASPAFAAGISLARAGDMGLARRAELSCRDEHTAALGWTPEKVYAARQVHSRRVLVVERQSVDQVREEEADGLVSARADVLLTVTVADCLPIILVDPSARIFAIVHSGWKGTGIVRHALGVMESLGARAGSVTAVIGPGIGPCCYRVPEERHARFCREFGEHAVGRAPDGGAVLDLTRANLGILEQCGVTAVSAARECTACSPYLGSFRRQGQRFTRMLAWVGARHV
jgi:polyphenol oxidase